MRRPSLVLSGPVLLIVSCGGGNAPTTGGPGAVGAAVIQWVSDADNAGDGSDVRVRYVPPADADGVAEYRALLLPATAPAPTPEEAVSAPPGSWVGSAPSAAPVEVRFPANATDTEGNPVADGSALVVRVLSVPASADLEPALSEPSRTLTLARTNLVKTLTTQIQAGTGGMDVDAEGNVYAADFGASLDGPPGTRVFRITPGGVVSTWATGLTGASGNAFGSNGDLFQSNISGGRVSRIMPDGSVSTFAEGLQGGPVGIAITPGDTLFVVNCGQNLIHRITPAGDVSPFVSDPLFNCPNGITLADDGHFYVANFGNGAVLRVTRQGGVSTLATLPGGNNGHLLFGNGVLYVVARGAHQIYRVTLDGTVGLLAGSGTRGLRDGAATEATLSLTNDVALSPDGRILYFNDVAQTSQNDRVISPVVVRMVVLDEGG